MRTPMLDRKIPVARSSADQWKAAGVTGTLNNGVAFLLRKNKIDHYDGHAHITSGARVAR